MAMRERVLVFDLMPEEQARRLATALNNPGELNPDGRYPCRLCVRRFDSPGALGGHMRQHSIRGEIGPAGFAACHGYPK